MKGEKFRRCSYVLGKDHSLDILESIHSCGWSKASDIAKELDLHVATASKYLAELEEIDVLESREAKGKTRQVIEYRIKDPKIELTYDISKKRTHEGQLQGFYTDIYNSILDRTEKVYGLKPTDIPDHEGKDPTDNETMKEALRQLCKYNEDKLGLFTTQRLICSACKPILDNDKRSLTSYELFQDLPVKYFEKLMEELRSNE